MAELFNVVFAGEIAGKADPAVVRANVGKLFNASEAILDKLFSGQPIAVKKQVDRETAMALRAKMKLAGANTRLVPVDEQGRPLPGADAPAAAPAPVAPGPTMAERVKVLAEQHAKEEAAKPRDDQPPPPADVAKVTTWAMFPRGWVLSIPRPAAKAPDLPNLANFVLAPVGADMLLAKERVVLKPVQVDISSLSMAATGSDVLRPNERAVVKPVQVDISTISMAPPGTELEELKEHKPLVNPDISHLSIVKN